MPEPGLEITSGCVVWNGSCVTGDWRQNGGDVSGFVYIVGAGPGDPDLLTLKALKAIRAADVILYDRLVNSTILDYAETGCELIYVGKQDGRHTMPQEEINQQLYLHARTGKTVVRLKGGDPFIFGRGGEEEVYLRERGIEFETVPGISSSVAAPAYAGIPVTHRKFASSYAVITGHECSGKMKSIDWSALIGVDTLVFLMGVRNRSKIARKLIEAGRDPLQPVAFIERGTTPEQNVIISTLRELVDNPPEVESPAVFVVGDVVRLRAFLAPSEKASMPERVATLQAFPTDVSDGASARIVRHRTV
jgi:uroporphyrin-III C-methyltransferase